LSMSVGSGSSVHDFDGAAVMTDLTSSVVKGWKWSRVSVANGSIGLPKGSLPVLFLLTGRFFGFSHRRGDMMHRSM